MKATSDGRERIPRLVLYALFPMLTCQIDNGFLVTLESFHRVTTSIYGRAEGGHRTELQAGITSIQVSKSYSIDRDANRDEEKVSSVIID